MTLTMDYKLVFRKESDRNKIYKEFVLYDLKVKSDMEKKASDKRMLILKDKKNK